MSVSRRFAHVISGIIPQATVLEPILFLSFIFDIDKNIDSIASMFADDTRVLGKIGTLEGAENLQLDLN